MILDKVSGLELVATHVARHVVWVDVDTVLKGLENVLGCKLVSTRVTGELIKICS